MSAYDNQLPRIPLEVLERVARMTDNITAALNTSGVLSACADLQRLTAQSLAASFEAHQRLSAAMQPLLDCLAKLADELPSPADTLQSLADKIDDSVLDETSAAIEEALPYMEPEAREYCVAEALPKLMPKERQKLSLSQFLAIVEALVTIAGFAHGLYRDKHTAQCPHESNPAIVQQTETSADRPQSEDNSFLIFDDGLQAVDGSRESPDLVGQEATVDGQGGSED